MGTNTLFIPSKIELPMNRRLFLKITLTTAGLIIQGPFPSQAQPSSQTPSTHRLNPWLHIAPDNTITLQVPYSELGQGIHTALAMLVAEELNVDWSTLQVTLGPIDEANEHPSLGQQATWGSFSVRGSWEILRQAAASARDRLLRTAAQHWRVELATCEAQQGNIVHLETGRRLSFGELITRATALRHRDSEFISLKPTTEFKIIGHSPPQLNNWAKITGTAVFGLDIRRPHMLYAATQKVPILGGQFQHLPTQLPDSQLSLIKLPNAIAVVGQHYWPARQALEKLDLSILPPTDLATDHVKPLFQNSLHTAKAKTVLQIGNPETVLKTLSHPMTAEYSVPFLAQVPLEPTNCTAEVHPDHCEVWLPTQAQQRTLNQIMTLTGLPEEAITLHTTHIGGSFGQHFTTDDCVEQAILLAQQLRKPVQVIWSREEDLQQGHYRPAMLAQLTAGLDAQNLPTVLKIQVVGPSILEQMAPQWLTEEIDYLTLGGLLPPIYEIPHQLVNYTPHSTPIPIGFWRSGGHSHNAFFLESFIDEIAYAGHHDPYQLRKTLVAGQPRILNVLNQLAERVNWGKSTHSGRYLGLGIYQAFNSFIGQAAELSLTAQGQIKIHRITCVLDCGIAVHPGLIENQIVGGIVFGLSALHQAITLHNGQVKQSNFHDYPILKMSQVPDIKVHILPGEHEPGGVGAISTPLVAPVITNALFAASGERIRQLPLKLGF